MISHSEHSQTVNGMIIVHMQFGVQNGHYFHLLICEFRFQSRNDSISVKYVLYSKPQLSSVICLRITVHMNSLPTHRNQCLLHSTKNIVGNRPRYIYSWNILTDHLRRSMQRFGWTLSDSKVSHSLVQKRELISDRRSSVARSTPSCSYQIIITLSFPMMSSCRPCGNINHCVSFENFHL